MDLTDLYKEAMTGDVLAVHGSSFVQEGIQQATGCFCHVAQVITPFPGSITVEETVEGIGYQNMTLEDWLAGRAGQKIYFGQAPEIVRTNRQLIIDRFAYYQDPEHRKYHYDELIKVWLFDKFSQALPSDGEVCSLLVIDNWRAAGYSMAGNPSPSDFLDLAESVSRINI
jgi:hypothetical protein